MQGTDIPVKVIKCNNNFLVEQICTYFNESVRKGKFPKCLKIPNITPAFKKSTRAIECLIEGRGWNKWRG